MILIAVLYITLFCNACTAW